MGFMVTGITLFSQEMITLFCHGPLIVDATYLKVRRGTRVVSQALLITAGIRLDGYREILSIDLMDSEREGYWFDHFEMLKKRGLHGVQLVVSDGHIGIQNAVSRAFLGSSWQMCHVHLHRIIQSKGIKKCDTKKVAGIVRNGIQGDITALNTAIEELEEMGYISAASSLERFSTDLLNYRAFPEEHWKRIRTTNMLERVNRESATRSCIGDCGSTRRPIRLGCTYRGMRLW
jgi:transposase-like protein